MCEGDFPDRCFRIPDLKVWDKKTPMVIDLKSALSQLPLPATSAWPAGVWDKTLFTHGTMSVVAFAPRGRDYQTHHSQDELYIIVKGSGTLMVADAAHRFSEGDVLFVPALVHHRFVDFTEDLTTWAIFWGPQGGESDITTQNDPRRRNDESS
jgi:mannose-6-phosphate isomerase-like protein (cupin superfamily)